MTHELTFDGVSDVDDDVMAMMNCVSKKVNRRKCSYFH